MSSWESPLLDAGPFGVSERRFIAPPLGLYVPPTARLSRYSTTQCIYGPQAGSDAAFDVKQYDLGEREAVMWWRGKRLVLDMNPSRIAGMTNPRKFTLNTADKLLNVDGKEGTSAMAASTLYYVYINPDGVVRAASTAPAYSWQGVRALGFNSTGGLDWLFVGYIRTDASTRFVDTTTSRFVVNWFNRISKNLFANPGYTDDNLATTWTTASTTWARANAGAGSTIDFVANGEDAVFYRGLGSFTGSIASSPRVGVGEDSQTSATTYNWATVAASNAEAANAAVGWSYVPSEGYHYLELLVRTDGGTATFYADEARNGAVADPRGTLITAQVRV